MEAVAAKLHLASCSVLTVAGMAMTTLAAAAALAVGVATFSIPKRIKIQDIQDIVMLAMRNMGELAAAAADTNHMYTTVEVEYMVGQAIVNLRLLRA
nr:MAG TPA: hypothetical protein [Caudoviricetes sp.]